MLDGFAVGIALNVELTGLGKLNELADSLTKINGVIGEVEAKMSALGGAIDRAFSSTAVSNFNNQLRNSLSTVRQLSSAMGQVKMGAPSGGGTTGTPSSSKTDNFYRAQEVADAQHMDRLRTQDLNFQRGLEVADAQAIGKKLTQEENFQRALEVGDAQAMSRRLTQEQNFQRSLEVADAQHMERRRVAEQRESERFGTGMLATGLKMFAGFEVLKLGEQGVRAAAEFDTEKATLRGQGYTEEQINKMVSAAAHTNVAGLSIRDKLIGQQELNSILDPGGKTGAVTPEIAKTISQVAQYITKETGHGTVETNQVIVARSAQLMGLKLRPDGSFDPDSLNKNAVMFGRMTGAMGRNTDPEVFAHNIKQASQYLRDTTGKGVDPQQFAQLGVLTEQLGAQGGAAFASLSRQSARGEVAGAQGRQFLVRFGLFGGERMGQEFGFDPLAKGGKGGMGIMDRTAVMKGFDPAHPEQFAEVMRKAIITTLTREGGGKAPDQKIVDNFMAQWQNMRSGRAESAIGTPAGLEEVKKLQDAYNLTAPDAEALAASVHDFDGGLQALGASMSSVIGLLGAPVMRDLGGIFYHMADGITALGGFLSDHPFIADTLVAIGEGFAIWGAALAVFNIAKMIGLAGALKNVVTAVASLAVVAKDLGALAIALAGLPELIVGFTAALGGIATYFNGQREAKGQDDAAKQGYTEPVGSMNEDGSFNQYRNPKTGEVKSFGLPGLDQSNVAPPKPPEVTKLPEVEVTAPKIAPTTPPVPPPRPVPPVSPIVQHTWTNLPVSHGAGFQDTVAGSPVSSMTPIHPTSSTGLQPPAIQALETRPQPKVPDVKLADFYATNLYVQNLIGPGGKSATGGTTSPSAAGASGGIPSRGSPTGHPGIPTRSGGLAVGGMHGGGGAAPTAFNAAGSTFAQKSPAIMARLMKDLNLTKEQAAGILGNLGHESAGFKAFHEGGKAADQGGIGWAQWTGVRRREFEAWSKAHGLDPHSDTANLGFLEHELQGKEAASLAALRGVKGTGTGAVDRATDTFMRTNERPGIPALGNRLSYARSAYNTDTDAASPIMPASATNEQNRVLPPTPQHQLNSQIDIHLDDQVIATHMFKNMFDFNPSDNAGPTTFDKRMSPWAPGSSMPR